MTVTLGLTQSNLLNPQPSLLPNSRLWPVVFSLSVRPRNTIALLIVTAAMTIFSVPISAQLAPPSVSSLNSSSDSNRPLAVEQAFPWFASIMNHTYSITWTPAVGHYLYRHSFAFSLIARSGEDPVPLNFRLPDGIKKTDQFFGDIEAYYEPVQAKLILEGIPDPQASLLIEYQGCADWGFCYPPQKAVHPLTP
ncbi:MAG: protein-disulfide reductase DsbD N-terminal domain-containing protein [Gammaproteobacteria bacterium]|nr:protein-disulfide reductase DsbD N-terminal domain-containing protein [Gammaproteobacteria bacterium]